VVESLLNLIDQDQAQVTRPQFRQSRVDGEKLAVDFLYLGGSPSALQALLQQGQDFAVSATALALILIKHHPIEGAPEDLGLSANVFVAPITRTADDHRALAAGA
jgi:hypothetical protein